MKLMPICLSAFAAVLLMGCPTNSNTGITTETYGDDVVAINSAVAYAECENDGRNAEGNYTIDPSCTRGGAVQTIRMLVEANSRPIAVNRAGSGAIRDYLVGLESGPRVWSDVSSAWLQRVYGANGNQPFWWTGSDWSEQASGLTAGMREVIVDGLLPGNYLMQERVLPANPSAAQIAQIDIELSAGLLRYIRDVQVGRFGPQRDSFDPSDIFLSARNASDIEAWMANLAPRDAFYQSLRQAALAQDHTSIRFRTLNDFYSFAVTMERQRWAPVEFTRDEGRYIILNVGSQETWAMNGLNREIGMNAVIGRPSRRTPVRDDTVSSIKFSPDWTAPYSIIEKDIVPRAQEDPELLNELELVMKDGNGRRIDPHDVNWNSINVRNYVFRQPPGPLNLLGGVRFGLNNSSAIYMHDSPDRVFFHRELRAYSSGCMRLEKSHELAYWLLSHEDPSWTMESVREAMDSGETEMISLRDRVPVRVIYTTAWVSHTNELRLTPDIYGRDADLRARMGFPTQQQIDENPEADQEFTIGDFF